MILQWSQHGGRLVSADAGGSIVGWKIDSRNQLLMTFHHELKDSFTHIAFKISPPKPAVDLRYSNSTCYERNNQGFDQMNNREQKFTKLLIQFNNSY